MKKKSIYECYEEIKQREIAELKARLKAFGGAAHFGPDYTGEYATGTDCPIVMCNLNGFEPHPADVRIMCVGLSDDDELTILGCEIGSSMCATWCEDEMPIDIDDIAYGYVEFITDLVPQRKLDLGKDAYGFSETLVEFSHLLYDKLYEKYGDSFEVMHEIYDIAFKFECELKERGMYDDDEDYLIAIDKHAEKIIEEL